jgi:pimeloyl-ACP methyl ester carboxylesterase
LAVREAQAGLSTGYADAGGDRIHFVETGTGCPLLLLHGAFGSGRSILETHFGKALAARYRVIAPDCLAHGRSDAPADPTRYGARPRAFQLVAVLDALGIAQAHVVGYSMGGWMASALAAYQPQRLLSLAIGGWDVVDGMYTPASVWGLPEITYTILSAMVRRERPDLLAWVRPQDEPALAAAINGMNDLNGLADAVARVPVPVALWLGEDDLYYPACVRFAAANALALITLPGDHVSMLEQHGVEAARQVRAFLASGKRARAARSSGPA